MKVKHLKVHCFLKLRQVASFFKKFNQTNKRKIKVRLETGSEYNFEHTVKPFFQMQSNSSAASLPKHRLPSTRLPLCSTSKMWAQRRTCKASYHSFHSLFLPARTASSMLARTSKSAPYFRLVTDLC